MELRFGLPNQALALGIVGFGDAFAFVAFALVTANRQNDGQFLSFLSVLSV